MQWVITSPPKTQWRLLLGILISVLGDRVGDNTKNTVAAKVKNKHHCLQFLKKISLLKKSQVHILSHAPYSTFL